MCDSKQVLTIFEHSKILFESIVFDQLVRFFSIKMSVYVYDINDKLPEIV